VHLLHVFVNFGQFACLLEFVFIACVFSLLLFGCEYMKLTLVSSAKCIYCVSSGTLGLLSDSYLVTVLS